MRRLLTPTTLGLLLFLPALALQLIPLSGITWHHPPDGTVEASWSIGFPVTYLSFSPESRWTFHPAGLLSLALTWFVPMALGGTLDRFARRQLPRARLAFSLAWLVVAAELLALSVSMAFSTTYWGYPWTRPPLPSGLGEVRWERLSAFASDDDGHRWTDVPDAGWLRDNLEDDTECCRLARVGQTPTEVLPGLGVEALGEAENQLLTHIELERGEPGSVFARQLRGVVVSGTHPERGAVFYATFETGEVSNDHHAIEEAWWTRSPVTLLHHRRIYADVAGIEGFTAPAVFVTLSVLLLCFVLPLGFSAWLLVRSVWRWAVR